METIFDAGASQFGHPELYQEEEGDNCSEREKEAG